MEFQCKLRSNFVSLITVSIFEKKKKLTKKGFWKIFCHDQVYYHERNPRFAPKKNLPQVN